MIINLIDLTRYIGGELVYYNKDNKATNIRGSDSRPKKGTLYFLLSYESNQDKLVKRLKKVKASGVVIKKSYEYNDQLFIKNKINIIYVKSISEAYLDAALYYRKLFNIPIIEVTGSAGKTTTKEMIGSVLSEYYHTLTGEENYNAPSGVAYNLFQLNSEHEVAVVEAGMKDLGIIDLSSNIIRPYIGVITTIQRAHYSSIGSINKIIKAKAELLKHIDQDGILIINGDDENISKMDKSHFKGKVYKFGLDKHNDIYATDISYRNQKAQFTVHYENEIFECELDTFGEYNIRNALSAILVGKLMMINNETIIKGLKKFKPVHRRQEVIQLKHGITLINDNFNANPESTIQLIKELPRIREDKKLILVFGDIERPSKSIEKYAKEIHYDIGQELAKSDFNYLIAIGKWAKKYIEACKNQGINHDQLFYFEDVYEAKHTLKKLVTDQTIVVFKAQKAYIDLKYLIRSLE